MSPEEFDDAARGLTDVGSRRAAGTALFAAILAVLTGGLSAARNLRDPRKGRKNSGKKADRKDKNKKSHKKKKSGRSGCKVKHNEKQILDFISKAAKKYGQSNSAMVRVARCESNLDPCAYNKSGPYFGLYQFLKSTWKTTPYKNDSIYDPKAQAMAAAWMWKQGRKNEWACK